MTDRTTPDDDSAGATSGGLAGFSFAIDFSGDTGGAADAATQIGRAHV